MQLNSLKLLNFRNYDDLYIDFNKKVNLLVGKNGQGKTNIVESIYMLSFGKSFRTSKDKEIIKFDNTIAPIMHQIAKNANENRKLSTLRDTLLPKLLSGEIPVNQAAK